MSVLSLPRIVLNGTTSWNPATNNNSLANAYNKDPVAIALPDGVTYDTLDAWLIEYDEQSGGTNGSWNVYGQMQSDFDAKVVGTKTAGTKTAEPDAGDRILGGAVTFQGGTPKLVDVNPYSSVSSQVFFGGFGVEAEGGVGFSGPGSCRMTSRRPFMKRNSAGLAIAGNMGVVWQTTIAKDAIEWGEGFASSGVLGDLHRAMDRSDVLGVMLRMSSYTTLYFSAVIDGGLTTPGNGTPEMKAAFQKLAQRWASLQPVKVGNVAEAFNPAVSQLVGVIGLWEEGELATVPTERVLAMHTESLGPAQAKVQKPQKTGQKNVQSPEHGKGKGVLSLDLQNTFPEDGAGSEKASSGSYQLVARADDGKITPIATLTPDDYAKSVYDAGGGLLDVHFDEANRDAVETGRLELLAVTGPGKGGGPAAEPALSQVRLYADTDDRSVYLNQGDRSTVVVRVYENGARPTRATKVLVSPYYPPQQPPSEGTWCLVTGNDEDCPKNVELGGGTAQPDGLVLDVSDSGVAQFSVSAFAPGNAFVTFLPFYAGGDPPTPPPSLPINEIATTGYTSVRVLPFDDELGATPQDQITWELVYEHVLRAFDLVYRGMSAGVFSLGDEATVRQHASSIEGFTRLDQFESPLYMPVTRDLSRGKRNLLVRFLNPGSGAT